MAVSQTYTRQSARLQKVYAFLHFCRILLYFRVGSLKIWATTHSFRLIELWDYDLLDKKKKRWRKLLFLILKGLAVPIWLIFPWLFLVRRSFWLTITSHWSFEESNQHLSYLLIVGLVFIYTSFRLLVGH